MQGDLPYRDMLIALPPGPSESDVYAEHQAVWRELVRTGMPSKHGEVAPFLFVRNGPLIEVRVAHPIVHAPLARPRVAGGFRCRLVMETRLAAGGVLPIHDAEIPVCAETLLRRHGLHVDALVVERTLRLQGWKHAHRIRLHVADVCVRGHFESPQRAAAAWIGGIGRAKRLGCGMLRAA